MKISDNKFVAVCYDLHVSNAEENDGALELMESAPKEQPLKFIFGTGQMLPGFEKNLNDLEVGEKFQFTLDPANGYGEFMDDHVVELPKSIFEVDGKFDDEYIKEGVTLPMENAEGDRMYGSVLEVKDDVVVMDFNHPLAGETLHFSGEVLDVHDPTDEEIAALNSVGCGSAGCEGCKGC